MSQLGFRRTHVPKCEFMKLGKEPLRLDLSSSVLSEGQLCQALWQVTWASFEERTETWLTSWLASQSNQPPAEETHPWLPKEAHVQLTT